MSFFLLYVVKENDNFRLSLCSQQRKRAHCHMGWSEMSLKTVRMNANTPAQHQYASSDASGIVKNGN